MFNFATEQEVVEVGGVKFGGQPGRYPTVLFGTVFYGKRFKELDEKALTLAGDMMETGRRMSELTGVPGVVDVFISKEERIRRGLRPAVGAAGHSGARAVDFAEELLAKAFRGVYPIECDGPGSLAVSGDPQQFPTPAEVLAVLEPLMGELEMRLP